MRFPTFLYRLLPGDEGKIHIAPAWHQCSDTGIKTTHTAVGFIVPGDTAFILTNASMRWANGAGETTQRRRLMADPPSGSERYTIFENEASSAQDAADNWQGEVIIPPLWKVIFEATSTPGAASSSIQLEYFGYLIPRGTFAFRG